VSYKPHFSRFLTSDPQRLHAAAHSHHPWPDVTFAAQQQAWLDAAALHDDKWDHVFDTVLPQMQRHIAERLKLPDPATIAVAPNTHELVTRIVSCVPSPARVLTTDAEFHSFTRQLRRWEEAGRVTVQRVPSAPLASLGARLAEEAGRGGHDLVFFSQVLFDSGLVLDGLHEVVAAVPDDATFVVVDAYHGFMAVPTDFSASAGRAFYLAGGYKYAMAGEGACFLHCPPGYGARPVDTGWYAGFGDLVAGPGGTVGYPADGGRFLGATFDPSALYRFNAVQGWLDDLGVGVADIHRHVAALQEEFLRATEGLVAPPEAAPRGHFLSLRLPDAAAVFARLHERGVITDVRGDRLRIGFGLYHDPADVDEVAQHLAAAVRRSY
jgi:selenocysteine lyase/cysteine desulfurase